MSKKLSDLSYLVLDKEVLVLVMNHLDQLVPRSAQPEERRDVVEVAEPLVELGDRVVGQADVGADAVRSEEKYFVADKAVTVVASLHTTTNHLNFSVYNLLVGNSEKLRTVLNLGIQI